MSDCAYFSCRLKKNEPHLHLVFEDEGVSVSFQFAQDDAFFK